MYLILDVTPERNPSDYNASFSEVNAWPRMVHVSWIVLNKELKPIEDYDCIVKHDDREWSENILAKAKVDSEDVVKKSVDLTSILEAFNSSTEKVEYIISHNKKVHENVLGAEFMRKQIHPEFLSKERLCLMEESTFFCKIPNKRGEGYKWPSLQELYMTLFKQKYAPSGNARSDVIAATRSFIMLMKVNALEDIFDDE